MKVVASKAPALSSVGDDYLKYTRLCIYVVTRDQFRNLIYKVSKQGFGLLAYSEKLKYALTKSYTHLNKFVLRQFSNILTKD
jgi:hypothetical protein